MSSTKLRRVFWPVTAARGRNAPGWIVGWMNSDNDYFVFAILNEESIKVQKAVLTELMIDQSLAIGVVTYDTFLEAFGVVYL